MVLISYGLAQMERKILLQENGDSKFFAKDWDESWIGFE